MKKICKDCNIEKEIELFVKNKASKNGYKNTCDDEVEYQRVREIVIDLFEKIYKKYCN